MVCRYDAVVQKNPTFKEQAKQEFASVADGWLVAYAKANKLVVVTHEVFDSATRKRVKIPNLCNEFSVEYVNTFEMLKSLDVSFNWNR